MSTMQTLMQPDTERYKRLVIRLADANDDEIPDRETLEELGKSSTDFVADRDCRRKRRAALADLKRAGKLDKEAAAITIPPIADRGQTLLASITTVGELYEILEGIRLGAQAPAPEKQKRHELRSEAASIRGEALRTLGTTRDAALSTRIRGKRSFISDQSRAIANGKRVIEEGSQLRELERRLDALTRGAPDSRDADYPAEVCRRRIEEAMGRYPKNALRMADQAERVRGKALREIAAAEAEIAKMQKAGLALDCMKWSG